VDFEETIAAAGARLRATRRDRGISQRQLADIVGMDSSMVSRLERGHDAQLSTWLRVYAGLGQTIGIEVTELCEEEESWLAEEAERRRVRINDGLCTGKRRF
jgi:transcriptional regulator with XRE-family HTH domain